jgi:hypothetical protein
MFRSESTSIRIRFCDGFCEDSRLRELAVEALNPDREIRESSLVRRRARPRFIGLLRREKSRSSWQLSSIILFR